MLVADPSGAMVMLARRLGAKVSMVEPIALEEDAARIKLLRELRRGAPSALWVR